MSRVDQPVFFSSAVVPISFIPSRQVLTGESATMLRPPEHQVAGHQAAEGQLGPLIDSSGRFYKPLQGDSRGDREAAFYADFAGDVRVPAGVRRLFPAFHGVTLLPASDGRGPHPHLVLDDVLFPFLPSSPSVVDVKIGSRTCSPSSPDDYVVKCLAKDRATTSLRLGFRISGAAFGVGDKLSRKATKGFRAAEVRQILRRFVTVGGVDLAAEVYGGPEGILAQLLELKAWFEEQTSYHFFSTSVLMAHGRGGESGENKAAKPLVRLVDFAHVDEGDGVIDHNFLGGLCSLIKFISELWPESRWLGRIVAENGNPFLS